MKVYRLERNGIGPFLHREGFYSIKDGKRKLQRKLLHLKLQEKKCVDKWSAHQDAVANRDYMFGASSKVMLKAYFSYHLKEYFKLGYRIKTYEVPDNEVIEMGSECAFPVRYHKLKTRANVEKRLDELALTY